MHRACLVCTAIAQPQPSPDDLLRHAVDLHQAGDIPGAIAEYRAYLEQAPKSVMARSNLGVVLSKAGQYEEAIVEYRQALDLEPRNLPIRVNLALSYYKTSQISAAAEELTKAVEQQPSNRQAVFLLADCDLRLGENKKVIELLDPLEKESPNDKALIYLLGTALIRDNQPARGQLLVDRILREGDSAEARLLLGTTKMNAQDFAEALVDLKKRRRAQSAASRCLLLLRARAAQHRRHGRGRRRLPQRTGVQSQRFRFQPANGSPLQTGPALRRSQKLVRSRLARAARATPGCATSWPPWTWTIGNVEQACSKLEELIKETPHFVEAHVSLATVYYRLKRKADGDRERAIVLKLNAESQATQPGAKER